MQTQSVAPRKTVLLSFFLKIWYSLRLEWFSQLFKRSSLCFWATLYFVTHYDFSMDFIAFALDCTTFLKDVIDFLSDFVNSARNFVDSLRILSISLICCVSWFSWLSRFPRISKFPRRSWFPRCLAVFSIC